VHDAYQGFPDGFFDRADSTADDRFYDSPRMVTHIDDGAIAAVGELYEELGLCGADSGPVLDLMSSWISHFPHKPASLTVIGMNTAELAANTMADERHVVDLNTSPLLPLPDASFAAAVCCVSVDYLVRPIEVFNEVARVVRPGGVFVCTFSNRCFPTKAIRGWLGTDDAMHLTIVAEYFRRAQAWGQPVAQQRTPANHWGDPLYAVWAYRDT
jgi:SAM-dependent methyltransferase